MRSNGVRGRVIPATSSPHREYRRPSYPVNTPIPYATLRTLSSTAVPFQATPALLHDVQATL